MKRLEAIMLPISFRLALLLGCLAAPWLLAGSPQPGAMGCVDDYCAKTCPPIGPCFRPGGCDGYDKKCLLVQPPVCMTGCDPYCKKPAPEIRPRCLPASGPVDGCCPPNWFGLKRRS
jgi:hypothetical protein